MFPVYAIFVCIELWIMVHCTLCVLSLGYANVGCVGVRTIVQIPAWIRRKHTPPPTKKNILCIPTEARWAPSFPSLLFVLLKKNGRNQGLERWHKALPKSTQETLKRTSPFKSPTKPFRFPSYLFVLLEITPGCSQYMPSLCASSCESWCIALFVSWAWGMQMLGVLGLEQEYKFLHESVQNTPPQPKKIYYISPLKPAEQPVSLPLCLCSWRKMEETRGWSDGTNPCLNPPKRN